MSRILAEVLKTSKDLHEAGIFSDEQQTKFDLLCLPKTPPYSPDEIRELQVGNRGKKTRRGCP